MWFFFSTDNHELFLLPFEVLMASVMQSRYTTVRHSAVETSGPPQEAKHTCSGVCVPIIRSCSPLPSQFLPPFLVLFPCRLLLYNAFCIRRSSPGEKEEKNGRTVRSFVRSLYLSPSRSSQRARRKVKRNHERGKTGTRKITSIRVRT